MSEIAFIIPFSEGREISLLNCVQSLTRSIKEDFDLYIYDDISRTDLTARLLELKPTKSRFVFLNFRREISENRVGCGGARYHLLERAKVGSYKFVASVDDDTQFRESWLEEMVRATQLYPDYGIFTCSILKENGGLSALGSTIRSVDGFLIRQDIRKAKGDYFEVDAAPGGMKFMTRKAFTKLSFDPQFFCLEDIDFDLNVIRERIKVLAVNRTSILHKPVHAPAIEGFRSREVIESMIRRIYGKWGENYLRSYQCFKKLGLPDDDEALIHFFDES